MHLYFITVIAKLQNLNKTLQIANVVDLYKAYENGKNIKVI